MIEPPFQELSPQLHQLLKASTALSTVTVENRQYSELGWKQTTGEVRGAGQNTEARARQGNYRSLEVPYAAHLRKELNTERTAPPRHKMNACYLGKRQSDTVARYCNSSTIEAEAGGLRF